MRWALAVAMMGHGIAHLPGFVVAWQLATLPDLPHRTTVFGGLLDIGDVGTKLMGVGWAGLALVFIALGVGVLSRAWWPTSLAWLAVAISLAFCAAGWPDARLGLVANAVLAMALASQVGVP